MSEPWRKRCPEGHSSIKHGGQGDSYRCTTCNERYRGDPVDAKRVSGFPVAGDTIDQPAVNDILCKIVERYQQRERAYVRAGELHDRDHSSCISNKLAQLRQRGLIKPVTDTDHGALWQPTSDGIERARGGHRA